MFKLRKKSRIEHEIKELQLALVAQAIKFATTVTETYGSFVGETEEPTYRLLFSSGPPSVSSSHLNQMVLAIEGMGFFLHSLNRVSFRAGSEKLRETVFDPSVRQIASLLAKMIVSQSDALDLKTMEEGMLELICERELQYAEMPSLLGRSEDDAQNVCRIASQTIAESVDRPKHALVVQLIRTELLRSLVDMDLGSRVKRIEADL